MSLRGTNFYWLERKEGNYIFRESIQSLHTIAAYYALPDILLLLFSSRSRSRVVLCRVVKLSFSKVNKSLFLSLVFPNHIRSLSFFRFVGWEGSEARQDFHSIVWNFVQKQKKQKKVFILSVGCNNLHENMLLSILDITP